MPSATMSAQLNGLALFSVEQIELVRRLRNSGLTKQQLVQAFDAMDQLDRELGPVYSLPVTLQAIQHAAFQRQNLLQAVNAQQAASVVAANNAALTAAMVAAATQQQQANQKQTTQQPQTPQQALQQQQAVQQVIQQQQIQQQAAQQQTAQQPPQSQTPTTTTAASTGQGVKRPAEMQLTPQIAMADLTNINLPNLANGLMEFPDDPNENYMDEFREFISQGEQFCCEQIRNFAIRYSIKQQQVATLAGVSQSYVSRFLKGDVYEMSERSRRAIQKWYIMYRKNPAAIARAVNAILVTNGSPPKKLAVEMTMATPNGEIVFQPKRERFVFRPNHLDILERYFQADNYPSQEKREEISQACNNATISMAAGRPLREKETVSAQIIGNWFANKRKELKKIIREEGLDVSQVPLRPRGRPCRLLSDIVSMVSGDVSMMSGDMSTVSGDQGSNGSETASNYGSPHDASMMQQGLPSPHDASMMQQGLASPQDASTMQQGLASPDPPSLDAAYDDMGPPQHLVDEVEPPQDVMKNNNNAELNGQYSVNGAPPQLKAEAVTTEAQQAQDEEALSMSVELAAVNQAILSLTGTQPIIIKPDCSAQQMIIKQGLPTTTQAGDQL